MGVVAIFLKHSLHSDTFSEPQSQLQAPINRVSTRAFRAQKAGRGEGSQVVSAMDSPVIQVVIPNAGGVVVGFALG